MTQKFKIPLRIVKWIAFSLVIITFLSSQISRFFQILHLKEVGFNMLSISPISIILGLFASLSLIILVMIDKFVYKHKLRSPLQIVALLGGIGGILYNLFLIGIMVMRNV